VITARRLVAAGGLAMAAAWLAGRSPPAAAMPSGQQGDDQACLACHGQPGQTLTLDDGDILDVYVPEVMYRVSVHGQERVACTDCHVEISGYPHPPFQAADRRDASLQLYTACQACHADQYAQASDGAHAAALQAGNREAAVCTDCHSAHAVRRLKDPETGQPLPGARIWIPITCARCHSAIYQVYRDSVHGGALLTEDNIDVPTCVDCHGVHRIEDPTTSAFRLKSPGICAECHTDAQIMDRYGLSTQVLDTYVADFHGTTVTLFEKQSPDAETNKPVCFDCHGVHDIRRVDDPQKGLQVRENLLARCQICHPDATANFPDAWLSHYIPSPENAPWVYYVDQFYRFFIPGVLGGMAVLVLMDAGSGVLRRLRSARRAGPAGEVPAPTEQVEAVDPPAELDEQPPPGRSDQPSGAQDQAPPGVSMPDPDDRMGDGPPPAAPAQGPDDRMEDYPPPAAMDGRMEEHGLPADDEADEEPPDA
jgi:hypothetical protein